MKIDSVGKEKLSIPDEQRAKPSKRVTFITGLLLAILGIKLVISRISGQSDPFFAFDVLICLTAIIGVILKAKWGSLLALGYHAVGLILVLSLILGSLLTLNYHVWKILICNQDIFYILGTAFMNILIVGLAWREYTTIVAFDKEKKMRQIRRRNTIPD